MPKVNSEVLVWARETAGLTRDEAVKKLGIKDARGVDAVSRLGALESGETEPSRPTLVKMARNYRRPLLTFYLSAPPRKVGRGADFRSLPTEPRDAKTEALVDALIRDVRVRQSIVRAVLEDEEETEPLQWVGSCNMSDGHDKVLLALRGLLDVSLDAYRGQPDTDAAFHLLRERAGRAGVFVLLRGDMGNYYSAISVNAFRGFSLADQIAPFIVINDRDAQAAWSFTLLHELVHLLLGQTGFGSVRVDNDSERFCEQVAGQYLLPSQEVHSVRLRDGMEVNQADSVISQFALPRRISHTMVAYKAWQEGVISWDYYLQLANHFRSKWHEERVRRRDSTSKGGDYYVVRRHRLGSALLNLVGRLMSAGTLTTTRAAQILAVKPTQVQSVLDR